MNIKNFIKRTKVYYFLRNNTIKLRHKRELEKWMKISNKNNLPDPHLIKQDTIVKYSQEFNLDTLVETGTFYGDMIYAMLPHFKSIFSVELDKVLYQKAVNRFKNKEKVKLLNGDSGKVLKEIIKELNRPALFWLDGHYSGGETALGEKISPIYEELSCIIRNSEYDNVIIIDDAREFGSNEGYPTMDELQSFIKLNFNHVIFEVKNDSIRITPKVK